MCGAMADYFRTEGNVAFLLDGPVNAIRVCLVAGEEVFLPPVECGTGELVFLGMEVFRVHQTSASPSAEQFWTGGVPVDHDKGGDLIAPGVIRGDLEHVMDSRFFKVCMPARTGVHTRLWARRRRGSCLVLLFLGNALNLHINVALYQHVNHIGERGGCVERVDLEKLWG